MFEIHIKYLAGRLVCREKFPHLQTIWSSLTGNSNNFRFVISNILFNESHSGLSRNYFPNTKKFLQCGDIKEVLLHTATRATLHSHHFISFLFFPISQMSLKQFNMLIDMVVAALALAELRLVSVFALIPCHCRSSSWFSICLTSL